MAAPHQALAWHRPQGHATKRARHTDKHARTRARARQEKQPTRANAKLLRTLVPKHARLLSADPTRVSFCHCARQRVLSEPKLAELVQQLATAGKRLYSRALAHALRSLNSGAGLLPQPFPNGRMPRSSGKKATASQPERAPQQKEASHEEDTWRASQCQAGRSAIQLHMFHTSPRSGRPTHGAHRVGSSGGGNPQYLQRR